MILWSKEIREIRRARHWSVADLALKIGVSARTVEGWEQGRPVSLPAQMLLRRLEEVPNE